ncbi:MAG: Hpt domain-containing protein [Pseudomonadota bacterium]|nr:Hpt domain-containing protein [Pseudomonadota bacterium]
MSQDYIALEWVKGEIQETLLQAQQALEAYVEHPEDKSRLRFCLSYLHQVHGTLQMVEFYGAALLAEEMEAVALALTEGRLSNEQDGLEVLMQAIIQLPHYLEHVKVGRRDLPVVLLPILNELRSTRGENFLSETSLFTPHVEHNHPLNDAQKQMFGQPNFTQWLRKTRQMMQTATLQLLQDRDPELAKHYINKLFARLNKTMGGTPQGVIWLPALAFSEWLAKQDALPKSAKVLLRQLDQLLKQDLDKGVAAINRPPADELLKNLLFYVARTDARGEAIRLVQKRFRLDEALPDSDVMEEQTMGANTDAMSGALTALVEEITGVKEGLDQIVRGAAERSPALEDARLSIRQIADTMGILGLGMPRKVMQEQESMIVALQGRDEAVSADTELLDIAGALLYVEATLNGMIRDGNMTGNATDSAMSDAQRAVLREARNVLEQVKDAVVSYIAHQWETDKLEGVPQLLHTIEGSLNMIPLPRVAVLLSDLSSFIDEALLGDRPAPEWGVMDMVAEVLSGIEYYLERYSDQAAGVDVAIIERAEDTLARLMTACGITGDQEDLSAIDLPDEFGDESVEVTSFSTALGLDDSGAVTPEPLATGPNELDSISADTESTDAEHSADDAPVLDIESPDASGEPDVSGDSSASGDSSGSGGSSDATSNDDSDDDLIDDEIIEVFLDEAEEVIECLDEYWPQYVGNRDDQEALTTVRRSYHTLKGSGRMVGASVVGELAWAVENMFNRVLDNTIPVTDDLVDFVHLVNAQLPGLVEDFRLRRPASIDVAALEAYANATAQGEAPADLPSVDLAEHATQIEQAPETELAAETEHTLENDDTIDVLPVLEAELSKGHEADDAIPELTLDELHSGDAQSDEQTDDQDDDRLSLLEVFIAEAESHLAVVDEFAAESRAESYTNPISDPLQRALHTLKGSAHMAELAPLADIASPLEKLVKELRGYQQPNTPELCELLMIASAAIRDCLNLETLATLPYVPQGDAIVARIGELEIAQLSHLHQDSDNAPTSQQDITHFLAAGMDSLIEADELLQTWQAENRADVLDEITADLDSVAAAAGRIGLSRVEALSAALYTFYMNVRARHLSPDEGLVGMAAEAHEELLNLMDFLAAGQDLPDVTEMVERLRQWQFPEAVSSDEHVEEQIEESLEEPVEASTDEEYSAEDVDDSDATEVAESELIDALPVVDVIESLLADENQASDASDVTSVSDELTSSNLDSQSPAQSLPDNESPSVSDTQADTGSEVEPGTAVDLNQPTQTDLDEQEDDMILEIFLEEAEEISEAIEGILQKWEGNPDDLLPVAELQRELHTMKGGARMAELPEVSDLCHELETLYERLNDGVIERTDATFPLIHRSHDALASQLQAVRDGQVPEDAASLIEALKAHVKGDVVTEDSEASAFVPPVPDVQSESADESDREILGIFMEEANELLESLDDAVEAWRADTSSRAAPDEILRVLHTLKGGARLAGLTKLGDITHHFESDIQKSLDRNARYDDTFFAHVSERQNALQQQVDKVSAALAQDGVLVLGDDDLTVESANDIAPPVTTDLNGETSESDTPALPTDDALMSAAGSGDESGYGSENDDAVAPEHFDVTTDNTESASDEPLHHASSEQPESSVVSVMTDLPAKVAPAAPATGQVVDKAAARKAPAELVKVSADLLDNLVNLAGETSIGRGRLEEQVSDFSTTLGEMDQTLDRMRDQLRRLDMETEAQVLFRQERHGPEYEDFDPLEMDRYSAMQQLSRALMESASDLIDLRETMAQKTRDAETLLLQQSRVNTELQEGLMKTRMVPFQRLVPRLRRIVRQVSLELDKQVDLRVNNADGEMDRTILERMISPLEHMVRNAVDHGIEHGEQRAAAGKPAKGNIELDIRRDGGDVVLTLRDDGQGINLENVLRKAQERGLVDDDVRPSDHDIRQFILQPGFSTAEVITQISGRGVGMDVVSSEIKQMGGSVEIRSEEGAGSEFEIRLPFTVSVNRALMVRIGEDLYAVPLNNIQGIVRASVSELQNLYDLPEGERTFNYAGRDYQLGYLGAMLDEHLQPKISGQSMPLPLLLVRGQVPFALQADALLGSREIVVKSLGPQFSGVRGISGGTILGDGSVVIILDLPAMIRSHTSLEYQQARAIEQKAAEARHEQERQLPKVLVVDDSVTVRKVTTRLLERHGFEVSTAKDGMHAMEVLQDEKPDVMLLDIEMPRMDGFEVASLVRHDARLQDVPIIMITSRTGDKHRERAMSIGVNEYMGKPFQEEALLENIQRFLAQEVS